MPVLEIEIDAANNGGFFFRPLGKRIRGRFDPARTPGLSARYKPPDVIPGRRIGIDTDTGVGYVAEPLADEPHGSPLRRYIEGTGCGIDEPRHEFASINIDEWVGWLQRAVRSGVARVTQGKLPDNTRPVRDWLHTRTDTSPEERMTRALETQNAIALASMSEAKRAEVERILAGQRGK